MKIYYLTIAYNEDTDTIEYIEEEVVDNSSPKVFTEADLSGYFEEDLIRFMEEAYIVGES